MVKKIYLRKDPFRCSVLKELKSLDDDLCVCLDQSFEGKEAQVIYHGFVILEVKDWKKEALAFRTVKNGRMLGYFKLKQS